MEREEEEDDRTSEKEKLRPAVEKRLLINSPLRMDSLPDVVFADITDGPVIAIKDGIVAVVTVKIR